MLQPSVSVIVPTYNRGPLLRETVKSVLDQTFEDFELVIVDDGSTDCTPDVIGGFRDTRIRHLALEHCANLSVLRNVGIRNSRGQFTAFLDSDDLWRGDKLAVQMNFLDTNANVGFVVSGYDVFNTDGIQRTKVYADSPVLQTESVRSIFEDLLRGKMTLCSSSVVFRKALLDRAGLLNEGLRTGDYEFFTRLAFHSAAGIVHAPLVKVRKHADNSSLRFDAEGLEEAIFSVRRFYSLGLIQRDLRNERLLKYHYERAHILARRRHFSAACKEMFQCARLGPTKLNNWRFCGSMLWKSLRPQSEKARPE